MKLSPTAHRLLVDRYTYLEFAIVVLIFIEKGWWLVGVWALYFVTIVVDRRTYATWREAYEAKRNPVDNDESKA